MLAGTRYVPSTSSDPTFTVTVEQGGHEQTITNGKVMVKPMSFDIVIEMSEPMGVLVNASLNSRSFTKAINQKHLDKIPGFQETGMAEGLFNSDRAITLAELAPMYWF